ncbi:MAG: UbiA family prenyltransferase [Thermoanaerobaculia bacterium]|nr:UbiA family prenyltransferase [Thermoanaerobaculia bacterium]
MTEGPERADTSSAGVPLCVDLDGTLIRSDLLYEGLARLTQDGFGSLFLAPFWLSKGKAGFKREVANRIALEPSMLPYDLRLLEFLRKEKDRGRRLVLATASDRIWAESVAKHLEIFDEVMGSDGTTNLGGEAKARALVERFGDRGFDYAGNGATDRPVWKKARRAIAVNASPATETDLRQDGNLAERFPPSPLGLKTIVKAIRARQWVKNLLVFIPIITAHKLLDAGILAAGGLAFVAISLCASSIYLLNDLVDLESDRRHPEKRSRPLASGNLAIPTAILLSLFLMAAGLAISLSLPADAVKLIGVYLVTTTAYSLFLKRRVLVDVFTLSLLYTLRVLLGGAATGLLLSPWFLAFSVFTFLSLAFCKRASELARLKKSEMMEAPGRAYFTWDHLTVQSCGITSGYLAAIVLALYLQSDTVRRLYASPAWLWLIVPVFLYWISRIWVLVNRGVMDEDPVLFATKDRVTWLTAVVSAAILVLATYGPFHLPGVQP